ncbi:LamG domain-containing protein [Thiohalophilus sp.]|uniref:LamG domain-containing protein n=1 Tax=Thiohalophilus sp. TaxID=3028392 RepID=UPI002ACD3B14|nr:LamG domain-containing protein [Thiohalophilus sp.]MDZ7661486.1 LamG domain-containing protein [Thiohalophilus sp.]
MDRLTADKSFMPQYRQFEIRTSRPAGLWAWVLLVLGCLIWAPAALADRTIDSVTLDGSASVTVEPGAAITASVTVTTTGPPGNSPATRWESTDWRIATSPPGTISCEDTPDHRGAGTYNESFSVTAPTSSGTYNAYFIAYEDDSCGDGASTLFTLTDAVTVSLPPVADYRLDEDAWNGTSGEVLDSSGNADHGTAANGADTLDPGRICRAGLFDGNDDYVDVPNLSDNLNGTASLAFWIRTTQTGNNTAWQAPGITGVEQSGGTDDIFWGWIDAAGRIGITVGNDNSAKSNTVINDNLWHHIVLTRNATNGEYKIYIDGNLDTSGTIASGTIGTEYSSIGRIEDTGGSPEYFQGELDEILIFDSVLADSEVQQGYNNQSSGNNWDGSTRTCSGTPPPACDPITPGATTTNTSNGSPLSLDIPAGVETGDVLIAQVAVRRDDFCFTNCDNISAPAGWTKVRDDVSGLWLDRTSTQTIYYRVVDGSEPASYQWTFPNDRAAGGITAFSGVDVTDPIDDDSGQADDDSTITAPSVTSTEDNGYLVALFASASGNTDVTPTASLTTLYQPRTGGGPNGIAIATGIQALPNAGATGDRTATASDTDNIGQMLVLRPEDCPTGIDHFEIRHDGSALTCNPEPVTIRACLDSGCTTEASSDVSVTLSPTGWVGGDTKIISGGSASFDLRHTTAEAVTLGVASSSPSADFPPVCVNTADGTDSCELTFHDTGFLIDVPAQTSCETSTSLTLSAVRKSTTNPERCVPAFSSTTKNLKIWANYSDPASGTQNVTLTHATNDYTLPDAEPGTPNVPVQFDANADAIYNLTYPDAGRLTLNAKYEGSGDDAGLTMIGNDTYVTKPAKFYVYSDDANADCAAGDATCSAFTSAGTSFNLKVRAACSDNSVTPNFQLDNISLGHNLVAPGGGDSGSINVTSFDISDTDNGEHLIDNQTISEVGVFTFTTSLGTGVDYFGETSIGSTADNTSDNIGRFTPHHFDVTATEACNGTFTYSGQPFTVTLDSLNLGGNPTRNYRDGFVRDPVISDAGNTTNFTNNTLDTTYFTTNDGIGVRNDVTYTFPDKETAPLSINQLRATDGDGVSSSGYTEGQLNIRSGRIALDNAYGSELEDLQVPMFAQYYDGSAFVTNTLDECDNGVTIDLLNPTDTVTVGDGDSRGETCVQDNGNPGNTSGSDGCAVAALDTDIWYTDTPDDGVYTLYLKAPDSDANFDPDNPIYGNVTVRANAPAYLEFDWDDDGSEQDPESTATFGRYRGDDRIIYWREKFQ